jgi:hypothetical protein
MESGSPAAADAVLMSVAGRGWGAKVSEWGRGGAGGSAEQWPNEMSPTPDGRRKRLRGGEQGRRNRRGRAKAEYTC